MNHRKARVSRALLSVGVAVLVAGSMALVALGAGATLGQTAVVAVAGVLVGGGVAWYIVPTGVSPAEKQRGTNSGLDNPFTDGGDGEDSESDTRERSTSKTRSGRR